MRYGDVSELRVHIRYPPDSAWGREVEWVLGAPHTLGCAAAAGPSCGPHPCRLLAVAGAGAGAGAGAVARMVVLQSGRALALYRLAGGKGRLSLHQKEGSEGVRLW